MKLVKNIAAAASLFVIYAMAMVSAYAVQDQVSDQQKWSGQSLLFQDDSLGGHFTHTVPVVYTFRTPVSAPVFPFPADYNQAGAVSCAHAIRFHGLFNRHFSDVLNTLVEQKRAGLLYPFHFFL